MPQIPIYQSKTTIDPVSFPRANPQVASLPYEAMGDVAKAQIQAGELKQRTTQHYIELSNRLNELFEVNDTSERLTDAQMELTQAYDEIQQTPEWNANPREAQKAADARFKEIIQGKLGGIINPKKRSELESRLNALYGHFSINLGQEARKKEIDWARASLMGNLRKIHMAAVGAKDPALFGNMMAEARQLVADHLANGSITAQEAVKLYEGLSQGAAKDFASADILRDAVGAKARAETGQGPYAILPENDRLHVIDSAQRSALAKQHQLEQEIKAAQKQADTETVNRLIKFYDDLYKGNWNMAMSDITASGAVERYNITPEIQEDIIKSIGIRQRESNELERIEEKKKTTETEKKLANLAVSGKLTPEIIDLAGLDPDKTMKWHNTYERRNNRIEKETADLALQQGIADILDGKITGEDQLIPYLQGYGDQGVRVWKQLSDVFERRHELTKGGYWNMAKSAWMGKYKGIDNEKEEYNAFAMLLDAAVKDGKLKGDQILKAANIIMEQQEQSRVDGKMNQFWTWISGGYFGTPKSYVELWGESPLSQRPEETDAARRAVGRFINMKPREEESKPAEQQANPVIPEESVQSSKKIRKKIPSPTTIPESD